ncbi:DUF1616 domain-containing protein [Halonotius roseus]|uniref:DUF1616 domain-containing protein n=1 Tax=Halonotius roseus TaxID=2511997 RepID=A0A544QMW7_9EURY|nr:DUF1616 domain-containing protein [Halonotius roseus]TQQ80267.1 DUF1616 domain-containing protein [Halonotius roseus]
MTDRGSPSGLDADLLAVAVAVVVTAGVLLAGISGPLAWLVGIPLLLVWPGYAVVAALLPEAPTDGDAIAATPGDKRHSSPGWAVRLGFSLVLSAVVVAVTGVAVDQLAAIRLLPVVVALTVVTLAALVVAAMRRRQLPLAARAQPLSGWRSQGGADTGLRSSLLAPLWSTRQARTLAVAVLLLVGTVAFVAAAPPQEAAYTESYLLTETDSGEFVADGYPTTFVAGEGQPLALGLENNEHRPITYTVVAVAERVGPNGSVVSQQQVDSFTVALAHNESTVVERQIAPTQPGENVRLQFRVYTGEPSASTEPDQTTQLWIEVVDSAGA